MKRGGDKMLSKIVSNITPSATCELEGTVADLRHKGVDIIGMNAGEPDFQTPENRRLQRSFGEIMEYIMSQIRSVYQPERNKL